MPETISVKDVLLAILGICMGLAGIICICIGLLVIGSLGKTGYAFPLMMLFFLVGATLAVIGGAINPYMD